LISLLLCCLSLPALDWKTHEIVDGWSFDYVTEIAEDDNGISYRTDCNGLSMQVYSFETEAWANDEDLRYKPWELVETTYGYCPTIVFNSRKGSKVVGISYVRAQDDFGPYPMIVAYMLFNDRERGKMYFCLSSLFFSSLVDKEDEAENLESWGSVYDAFCSMAETLLPTHAEGIRNVMKGFYFTMSDEATDRAGIL